MSTQDSDIPFALGRSKGAKGLTQYEKEVAYTLLHRDKYPYKEILRVLGQGRWEGIDQAQLAGIRDWEFNQLSSEKIREFTQYSTKHDPRTGIHLIEDWMLYDARQHMISAVKSFNDPSARGRAAHFSILAKMAWTYILVDYHKRMNLKFQKLTKKDKLWVYPDTELLKEIPETLITLAMRANLDVLSEIRNAAIHTPSEPIANESEFYGMMQANCLSFETVIRKLYGDRVSLTNELGAALQFVAPTMRQLNETIDAPIPQEIPTYVMALEEAREKFPEEIELEFAVMSLRIPGTMEGAPTMIRNVSKEKGEQILNVLQSLEENYPYRPKQCAEMIRQRSGKKFNQNHHKSAVKYYTAKPVGGEQKVPHNAWCMYSVAFEDYRYSDAWIDHMVDAVQDEGVHKILSQLHAKIKPK